MQDRLQHVQSILNLFPPEPFYKLRRARLALINEPVLLADIFGANGAIGPVAPKLAEWLVSEAAVLSDPHRKASDVHAWLPFENDEARIGRRLPRYGRAYSRILDVPTEVASAQLGVPAEGRTFSLWLDSKGTGVSPDRKPVPEEYGTGLLPLDEALEEYLWSVILDRVLDHSGAVYRCLPIYAVIDLGFNFQAPDGRFRRAAVILRRGHFRNAGSDLPFAFSRDHLSCLIVELLARRYGITSAAVQPTLFLLKGDEITLLSGPGHKLLNKVNVSDLDVDPARLAGAEIDQINIQFGSSGLSQEIEMVDLVHFHTRPHFTRPLVSCVADRSGAWGGTILPESDDFAQPELAVSLDGGPFGWTIDELGEPVKKTRLTCRRLAELITEEEVEASHVHAQLEDFVNRSHFGKL